MAKEQAKVERGLQAKLVQLQQLEEVKQAILHERSVLSHCSANQYPAFCQVRLASACLSLHTLRLRKSATAQCDSELTKPS